MWRPDDPQGNEAAKVKYDIVRWTRGRGLDIGCGPQRAYPHFIPIDNGNHAQFGWTFDPGTIFSEADKLDMFADGSLDFIFSSHLLEHIEDTHKTLREWWSKIKVGGHLVLYLPHREMYPRCGTEGANPDHKHDFGPNDITKVMAEILAPLKAGGASFPRGSFDLKVNQNRARDNGPGEFGNEYSFYQVYEKIGGSHPKFSYKDVPKQKTACVVRYGGIGDMIQVAAVLPGLKKQGYHVTVMTTPEGKEIIEHDPNVDEFWLQEKNQVPNPELPAYWEDQERHFDKFIVLSESIEGTLLAYPGRVQYFWPKSVRHLRMNVNYLDFLQDVAEVPHGTEKLYYPTNEEMSNARHRRDEILRKSGCSKLILWSLNGSARHKINPYYDKVIARIMLHHPEWAVGTLGNASTIALEGGSWANEKRVEHLSGKLKIRETFALALVSDIVFGPETGVLNGVSMDPVRKVIMLSHSSHENLTRDWANTTVMVPEKTHCYPCHKMHVGLGDCEHKDIPKIWEIEGDAPLCVSEMDPDRIYNTLVSVMREEEQEAA